jgi:glycosyltransferase involved in cell wall biosynthesis
MVSACTIVARNYLSHARILATSFFAHHPDGAFTTLIIDDEERTVECAGEPCQCVRLCDIGLPSDEIGRLVAFYEVTELATAVKPPLLRHLLASGAHEIIYLDPDIKVYGSLEPIAALARQHGIVLTPHMLGPMPRDGRRVDEFHILAAGIYNLGFVAVGLGAAPFIEWWWDRTRREARIDPTRMMFTDQRWIDFVPALFDHYILKDPTCNVAYWNLHEREVVWDGERYLVNGQPLTFFHFSGFDATRPYLLSKHQGQRPRILLSERAGVARICAEYLGDLERAGVSRASALTYGWLLLPSGIPFDRQMRRLYRDGLDAAVEGVSAEPPCPFDPGREAEFLAWLSEPVAGGLRKTVSRYLYTIYQDRPDLQRAFPDLTDAGAEQYFEWIRGDGVAQHNIPAALLPPAPASAGDSALAYVPAARVTAGVNIAGYFRAEVGVGEAARLLTTAIDAAGIPYSTVAYDASPSRQAHPFTGRGDETAPYDVNIVCVNAEHTAGFAADVGREFFDGRYTVGYWFWELDRFPPSMHTAFDYVDEVWTATRFVAEGIRAIGRRPVHTIPLPVIRPMASPGVTRSTLGLPERFLFLFAFDFFSVLERKNPLGLIAAFKRAFAPDEGPVLLLKSVNGHQQLEDLERVRAAAADRPDILVVDEYYSAGEKNSLIGLCDCYVSLHRSEGFGLTMAEAMALGKPVIATAYSGNLEFMTGDNSYPVDYTLGSVPAGCDPYPTGSRWAEPNLDHAAALMRRVHDARAEATAKGEIARRDLLTRHDPKTTAAAVTRRLDEIRAADRGAGGASAFSTRLMSNTIPSRARPSDQVLEALERASSLLTPTPSVAPGRRLRRSLLMAQDFLFRTLRPYWFQQRQAQGLLIDSIRELAAAAAASARHQQDQRTAIAGIWTAVQKLENAVTAPASAHDVEVLAAEVQRLSTELASMRAAAGSGAADPAERHERGTTRARQ